MGMLYQRGKKGIWWIKFYRAGKPFYESSRSLRKGDAERLLKLREGAVADGRFTGLQAERLRFDDLAEALLTEQQVNRKASLAWTTRKVRTLARVFAGRRAMEMTTGHVERYTAQRQGQGAANATINRELAVLKAMFNKAMKAGTLPHRPHIPMLDEDNIRTGFFEAEAFHAVLRHLPAAIQPIARLAYVTGWRKGEVMTLTWKQMDLERGTVRLEPGTTKNKQGRTIFLTSDLRALFQELRAMTTALEHQREQIIPWVFHRDGAPIKDFRGAWNTACTRAGQPGRLFHDLRRTGIRNMTRAGVSRSVAMKISGHKTESVFRRYDIVDEGDLKEAAQRMGHVTTFVTVPTRRSLTQPHSTQDSHEAATA